MGSAERVIAAALLVLAATPAPRAEESSRSVHAIEGVHGCLSQKERRAAVEDGSAIRLSAAIHAIRNRMPGTVIRARLCRGAEGLVYVLTVLAHDGKVARIAIDAVKGTPIGGL